LNEGLPRNKLSTLVGWTSCPPLSTGGRYAHPTRKIVHFFIWKLLSKGNFDMSYKVSIVIEKDEYGYYAYCPELSGCQSQGDSLEEVQINIKEAVELYIETLSNSQKQALHKKEYSQ
jgi:predicted RNase H-like HicB family nuclease